MYTKNITQKRSATNYENISDLITSIISGSAGGAFLCADFGLSGILIGSVVGGFCSGYAEYRLIHKTAATPGKQS